MKPHSAYATIGNHRFFTTTCHRQKYQNYQQKLGTYLENKVFFRNNVIKKIQISSIKYILD